jgi:hypothetical protein
LTSGCSFTRRGVVLSKPRTSLAKQNSSKAFVLRRNELIRFLKYSRIFFSSRGWLKRTIDMDAKTSFVKVAGNSHKSAVREQVIGEGDVFITVVKPQSVCQREVASHLKLISGIVSSRLQ